VAGQAVFGQDRADLLLKELEGRGIIGPAGDRKPEKDRDRHDNVAHQ
jgi:hypothetical protein